MDVLMVIARLTQVAPMVIAPLIQDVQTVTALLTQVAPMVIAPLIQDVQTVTAHTIPQHAPMVIVQNQIQAVQMELARQIQAALMVLVQVITSLISISSQAVTQTALTIMATGLYPLLFSVRITFM
jgi:hypothetical protein